MAARVFQAVPAGLGRWLEAAGLAPVSTLIIITTHCNSHVNHSSERGQGPLAGDGMGGANVEYLQQQGLIRPFVPVYLQDGPGQPSDGISRSK